MPVAGFSETETQTTEEQRFERLIELSPSAKLVFKVLQKEESPLEPGEISERTLLPSRTTRYALNKLESADLVAERPSLKDARKQLYEPQPVTRTGSQTT